MMDPVCRMEIRPEQAVASTIFQGQRVYFCSESCYGEFLDVPHRYAGWDDGPDRRTGAVGFDSSLQRVLAVGHPNRWAKATGRPMAMGRLAHEIGPGSSEEVRNVDRLTAVTDRPATWSQVW